MDSFYDEMEPRTSRPFLPSYQDQIDAVKLQVSEPSLMNTAIVTKGQQTNWVLDGINVLRFHNNQPLDIQICKEQSPSTRCSSEDLGGYNSQMQINKPVIGVCQSGDAELKKLIENQNIQLQMLHKQVEKLLEYQELLKNVRGEKVTVNESTQTSIINKDHVSLRSTGTNLFHSDEYLPNQQTMSDKSEITLGFQDLRLETIVEQPPSPPCSVVVNMQEYPESMSEQFCLAKTDDSHDIMEQVQKLLAEANTVNHPCVSQANNHQIKGIPSHELESSLKKVTIKQVHDVGISLNTTSLNRLLLVNSTRSSSWEINHKETDKSIEMQQLARKYLGRLEFAEEKSVFRNSVEMSMSSQQYLAKYGLLSTHTKFNPK